MTGQGSSEREKIKNLENQLKRALADYANLQKRIESEREQIIKFGERVLLTKFLPILDILESAEKAARAEKAHGVGQGLELALNQFKKILAEEGIEEINTSGHFDPHWHEAVEIVKGKKDNEIAQVIERGFRIGERVLRPAKVKVTKRNLETPNA
jgi:molecular chaperone GrpE